MPTIFVCGATGAQGGAMVNNLLKSNMKAQAIARDPSSKASQALQSAGATLFKGDFDDEDSLRQGMKGCTGLFLNLKPDLTDISRELVQAKRILSVAKEVGIQQVVYSSGFAVPEPQRLRYWDPNSFVANILLSKQAVEAEVRSAGFKTWTIIRPGSFMANMLPPHVHMMYAGLVDKGEFATALTPETVLPMIDTNDIGKFGAAAFGDPDRFHEKEFEIASELLGMDDLVKSLSRATGRHLKVNYLAEDEVDRQKATNPFLAGQQFARDMVQFVDMDEVRAWGIPLGTFEQFLEREKDRVAQAYCV
ncbi:hypothetical protein P175DRAFT_0427944 [Aspergillus ochraceoroseus IBT 24754]|uniref:NmrA-like domain-containing protein n=3 Tax=Aspergillus subgen. Nidulantes TaxID=2720870 RepID=A0A0F8WGJ4_9EURO|nr:uncharacterized protein P175DRAFT_0427944 [Aspergillus ochraceoroseus IBT 24754]KKK16910.1 hypothetical protein ARAM_002673 [Aspergillus rambellii]PTU24179.1 hypothetical protein P175DRAFT_0427944 [Aspergillus ochraceoroseus IBT 24754]